MLGLRRLWAKITQSKAGKEVEHIALDLVARPGFHDFITKYKDTAESIVADLINPASGKPVQAIFTDGYELLKGEIASDVEHHDSWLHQLLAFAYEEIVASFGKPTPAEPQQ